MVVDGIEITAVGFKPNRDEIKEYIKYVRGKVGNVERITVTLADDDHVELSWAKHNSKFERIRRITGYLVGTIDRWNDAKRAEEKDRVKHDGRQRHDSKGISSTSVFCSAGNRNEVGANSAIGIIGDADDLHTERNAER